MRTINPVDAEPFYRRLPLLPAAMFAMIFRRALRIDHIAAVSAGKAVVHRDTLGKRFALFRQQP